MRFTVEAWEPGYGTSVGDGARDGINDPSTRPVDPEVELSTGDWQPVEPAPTRGESSTGSVVFVDGVRRIDARIWIDEPVDSSPAGTSGGSPTMMSRPGVCASVAAGSVRCQPGRAEISAAVVRRGLYTASEYGESLDLTARSGRRRDTNGLGSYDIRSVADDSDEAMYFGVHQHMTELEHELSNDLDDESLVVFDGPLADRTGGAGGSVGYIKTQHVQYLPPPLHAMIGRLQIGQRTPLFAVGGRFPIWSWYLRLPIPVSHAMSGVVRLELPVADRTGSDLKQWAVDRADTVSRILPRFASEPHKDGRAPQNLYPIAGLERHLRHLLGDSRILERALRSATIETAATPL